MRRSYKNNELVTIISTWKLHNPFELYRKKYPVRYDVKSVNTIKQMVPVVENMIRKQLIDKGLIS